MEMGIKGLKTHWVLELQKYPRCMLVCRRLGENGWRTAMAEPGSRGGTVWVSILWAQGLPVIPVSPSVSMHLGEAATLLGALIYQEPSVMAEIPL